MSVASTTPTRSIERVSCVSDVFDFIEFSSRYDIVQLRVTVQALAVVARCSTHSIWSIARARFVFETKRNVRIYI